MAEGLFRSMAGEELSGKVAVGSAGIAAMPDGKPSRETLELLAERGVALDGFRSRMVDEELLGDATHVFCMSRGHLETLETLYPEFEEKYYLVCEFAEIEGSVGRDVPDPIGEGSAAYREVAACLEEALEGVVGFLKTELAKQEES